MVRSAADAITCEEFPSRLLVRLFECSIDFKNWTPLVTNSATLYDFTDFTAPDSPSQVYRAMLVP